MHCLDQPGRLDQQARSSLLLPDSCRPSQPCKGMFVGKFVVV